MLLLCGAKRLSLTKSAVSCIMSRRDAAYIGGRLVTTPKGGDEMFFVLTFHILGYTVTISIKCQNRHSGK